MFEPKKNSVSRKYPQPLGARQRRDAVSGSVKTNLEAVLMAFVLSITPKAAAQFEAGTIIVVGYSNHKIVIAADSRVGDEDGSHRDDACKITALDNKTLFAVTGRAQDRTKRGFILWDAFGQANAAFALLQQKQATGVRFNRSIAGEIAHTWSEMIADRISSNIRPEEFSRLKPKMIYLAGVFMGIENGGPQLALAIITQSTNPGEKFIPSSKEITPLPEKTIFTVLGGDTATFYEFLNDTSARAKKERRITNELAKQWSREESDTRMAIRLAQLVIKYRPNSDVGGPVDAADITIGQNVHWVQRKDKCE